ncbi:MAG TPA: alpha/beta hydrolase [Epsilonproteobacteria bacterium]|nr:alpha/beta hydrolase [Campylobacterota bacterium]
MMTYHFTGKNHHQTILFVPGLGANLSQFEEQHHYFDKNYQVLSITLPHKPNYTLENMADDIISLLDELQIETIHFVGNSMGGNIGYELLTKYPLKINSLTTFGTTPYLRTHKLIVLMAQMFIKIMPLYVIAKIGSYTGVNKTSRQKIYEMFMHLSKTSLYVTLPHIANFDYRQIIKEIEKPLCVIRAEEDENINRFLDNMIAIWKKEPWFILFEIENAGHFTNLDNPLNFNKNLEVFLKSINAKT